jgi:peptidyl-prolyl cis-trans isomerase D
MFDFVHRHNKAIQVVLFLLIVPSFVLVGVDGYTRMGDSGGTLVTMSGNTKISNAEFDAAHKRAIDRVKQSNPDIDSKLLDGEEFKNSTLDRMVMERIQTLAAKDGRLVVSDAALAKALRADPNIAALVGADGKLDTERYKALAASMGATTDQYEASRRAEIAAGQVFEPLIASRLTAQAASDLFTKALFQKREVQVLQLKPADFATQIKPTDAEIEAYYQAHTALFQIPESANFEFVVLDQANLMRALEVTDAQLKAYYEANAAQLSQAGPEERRASHILIAAGPSASKAERDAASAKATQLQAQLAKAPASFAQVAKTNSQDPGSAPSGGDLGFFSKGMMTKAFEDAAFAMKVGDVSAVVETEFGYHIIKLAEVKTPKVKSFDEVKPVIDATIRQQMVQQKYAEAAEQFSNMVYEQADGLKAVAEKFKLELQTATGATRTPAPGAKGALTNAKFLSAVFAADSVTKQRNTEAVDLGGNQLASARITQYTPAKTAAFADVKDQARQLFVMERAEEMAKKEGEKKLQEAKAATGGGQMPAAIVVARDKSENLSSKILNAALSADPSALPATVGVDLGKGGYAVVRVNKVLTDSTLDPAKAKQGQQQAAQAWAQSEVIAYLELLKARYKVETKPFVVAKDDAAGALKN